MKAPELLRRLRKYARKNGLAFDERRDRGKGGHITIFVGARMSRLPTGSGDLKTGMFRAILKQLDIKEDDL